MSIFDIQEIIDRFDNDVRQVEADRKSWENFQEEVIMPRVKKLKLQKPMRDFAVGVYMPKDFPYGLGQSLHSLCNAEKVSFYSVDCSGITSLNSAMGYLATISRAPYSLILLEHFDEIPDSPEKKYIENLLIHSWERDFIVKRNNFLVIFSTSKDYGNQTPELLKKIKSLDWHGNIRK
jgi:hypothetical protein